MYKHSWYNECIMLNFKIVTFIYFYVLKVHLLVCSLNGKLVIMLCWQNI